MDVVNEQLLALWDYLAGPKLWLSLGKVFLDIVIIIILAAIVIRIAKRVIKSVFHNKRQGRFRISARREETLSKLTESMLIYIVYFTVFIMILASVGIEVMPLLAGAGVAGLAIGFGAQNLVKDIISGFFIIFEDQFSVGDYVIISGLEGTVEEIGLRTTKIESWTGERQIVPNGGITQVINYSINNGLAVVDINVPYENDIATAEGIIEDILVGLPAKYEEIVSPPIIHGVQTLELSHFVIRVVAETLPVYQWSGARAIRKEVKERLYKEGIDIPAPRLVMYSRNEQPTAFEIDANTEQ